MDNANLLIDSKNENNWIFLNESVFYNLSQNWPLLYIGKTILYILRFLIDLIFILISKLNKVRILKWIVKYEILLVIFYYISVLMTVWATLAIRVFNESTSGTAACRCSERVTPYHPSTESQWYCTHLIGKLLTPRFCKGNL